MKKIHIIALSLILSLSFLISGAHAENGTPVRSNNKGAQNYTGSAAVMSSYLYDSGNDTMTRVEYVHPHVVVEKYSLQGDLLEQKYIAGEMDLFGGFYHYDDYNYLVFGQGNDAESDSAEVIRIVKYSKDWKRIGAVGVHGHNTVLPFRAGSLRMVGAGDRLIIRTCHLMYRSSDGLRHQANLTIAVNTSSMTVTDVYSKVSNPGSGYVSHSFNQFVAQDGADLIAADHGDAYPRSAVIFKYDNTLNSGKLADVARKEVLAFNGEIGQNATGASIGGLEVSDSKILLAGNSVDHASNADLSANRNIFVAAADKNNISDASVKWITKYPSDGEQKASTPQLVKVSGNLFLLMWTENDSITKILKLDGNGNVLESKNYSEAMLSDCQPKMIGGKVRWYTTRDSGPAFYSVDPSDLSSLTKTGSNELESVRISQKELTLDEGQTASLQAKLVPESPSEKVTVRWDSADPRIAEVTQDGVVTAKNSGETTIVVTATTQTHQYYDYCSLVVTNEHLTTCPSRKFTDVEKSRQHWTHMPIDYVLTKGYMAGVGDSRFAPNGIVTRGTIAQILYAAEGKPTVSKLDQFLDVQSGAWYAKAVNWAAEHKLVTGYGGKKFGPEDPVTRQQMVAIMYQYAKMKGYDTKSSGSLDGFSDRNKVSDWALEPMKWAVGHKVISGTGKGIEPNGTATRAQIAVILQAFDKNIRK